MRKMVTNVRQHILSPLSLLFVSFICGDKRVIFYFGNKEWKNNGSGVEVWLGSFYSRLSLLGYHKHQER